MGPELTETESTDPEVDSNRSIIAARNELDLRRELNAAAEDPIHPKIIADFPENRAPIGTPKRDEQIKEIRKRLQDT